jgi:hypothetical protein
VQGVPGEGDVQVWGFPGGGGAVLRGAGESADLQEGVGVALGAGAWVGDVFGGGAGCGELLDQGAERGTVFSRGRGGLGLLAWWGTVGVKVREDVSPDLMQRCGVE